VLFACGQNSVRSPIAAGLFAQMFGPAIYVSSAGVRKGELDPFAVAAMAEVGLDISKHKPITFEELDEWEGLNFDLIITLAPEAHHRALELTRTSGVDVEYWPTGAPTVTEGSREQRLDTYREIRDQLLGRIRSASRGRVPATNDDTGVRCTALLGFCLAAVVSFACNDIGGRIFRLVQRTQPTIRAGFSAVVDRPAIR